MSRIYLDYNATTPLRPEARDAMLHALDVGFGNPSSKHWAGRAARDLVEEARARVAALVDAPPSHVTFTSGATEAIYQALVSAGPGRVITTSVEHPAVGAAITSLGSRDHVTVAPAPMGAPSVGAIMEHVRAGATPALVGVMAANNVTGICSPITALADALADTTIPLMVDATQVAGKMRMAVQATYTILAAHKLGGPKGVGALISPPGLTRPVFRGGGQEGGRRGGTEPVPAIVGFGAAAQAVRRDIEARQAIEAGLRDLLEGAVTQALPGSWVVGAGAVRLPNTCCLVLPPGCEAEPVMIRLNRRGVAVSAGSACHAGAVEPSPVLLATGLSPDACFRTLRISLGHHTTRTEIEALATLLPAIAREVMAL